MVAYFCFWCSHRFIAKFIAYPEIMRRAGADFSIFGVLKCYNVVTIVFSTSLGLVVGVLTL
jgi:hypothetical protein